MRRLRIAVVAVFCAVSCSPVLAASSLTALFMANVKANVAFLDRSGKLAATRTSNRAIREFASTQVTEAFRMAEMLGVAPIRMAATSPDSDAVITGRSAATVQSLGEAANGRSALGQDDVSDLAHLQGRKFDDKLWLKQIDALSQLRADYEFYAAHGDDQVLVAVARRELPKVEAHLLALSKV